MPETSETGPDGLTKNQKIAVETRNVDLVVTAGAGAGKTRVLVQRFIGLLGDPALNLDLDELAAITFTEKAAGEMKERVRAELVKLAEASPDEPSVQRWRELQRRIGQARISTIHSFCARLLRENPVEAGLDPDFVVLDQTESQLLLLEAIDEEFLRGLADGDPDVLLLAGGYRLPRLSAALMSLYEEVRGSGLAWDEVQARTGQRQAALNQKAVSCRSELSAIVEALLASRGDPRLAPAAREALEMLAGIWSDVKGVIQAIPEDGPGWQEVFYALERLEAVPARAREVKDDLQKMREVAKQLAGAYLGICAGPYYDALFRLLRRIDASYSASKSRRRGVDFTDLELMARQLLKEHPELAGSRPAGGRPAGDHLAGGRIRSLKFLLVDEFQDTNGLQKEIIELIRGGVNLFVVGDPKQSIYRFRGAEVEVFAQTAGEIAGRGGLAVTLAENFRSRANLVNFVNSFFTRVMHAGGDPASVGYTAMDPRRPGSSQPAAELFIGFAPELSADEAREEEARALAYRLREMVVTGEALVAEEGKPGARNEELAAGGGKPASREDQTAQERLRPVRYGDIAMLFRTRSSLPIYEKALREAGVPYYTLDGRGFYTTQEIQDVLNFLRVVQNRNDDVALAGALRSPLFGVSDGELFRLRLIPGGGRLYEKLEELIRAGRSPDSLRDGLRKAWETVDKYRRARRRLGPAAIIEGLLADTQFVEVLLTRFNGGQAAANVRKLTEIAREFESSGFHDLGGFLAHIDTLLKRETDEGQAQLETEGADAVKLLTIHKSKGLEFPVVALPDLDRSRNGGGREAVYFAFDKEVGIGIALPDPDGAKKTPNLEEIEALDKARDFYEDQRLLYVAMTRARDYLILSGIFTDKHPKLEGPLDELDSWLKWICAILGIDPAKLPEGPAEVSLEGEVVRIQNPLRLSFSVAGSIAGEEAGMVKMAGADIAAVEIAATGSPREGLDEDGLERLLQRLEPLEISAEDQLVFYPVTALMAYEECPRRFYFQDVLGIPERPVLGKLPEEKAAGARGPAFFPASPGIASAGVGLPHKAQQLDPITKGEVVHRVLAQLVTPGQLDELLQGALLAEGITGRQLQAASEEIRPLVQNYLASEVFKAASTAKEVKNEVPFSYRCGRVIINGVVDKILVFGDRATVVDFKTNHIGVEQIPQFLQKYDLQLQAYTLVARELYGYRQVEAGIYFLHPNSFQQVAVADLSQIRRRIERLGVQISQGAGLSDFPRKREGCFECSFRRFCE